MALRKRGGEFHVGFGEFRFSGTELLHLFVSALVIALIFAYPFSECAGGLACPLAKLFLVFLVVGSAFVIHESCHKLTAQHYGVVSEYRMWSQGLLLALVMKLLFNFAIIAPGATYYEPFRRKGPYAAYFSENYLTKAEVGKIGWAGPMSNIALAAIFFALSPLMGSLAFTGIEINLWLAIFNLLPIPPMDGRKIFAWNWKVWLGTLAAAGGMFLVLLA